MFRRWMSLCLAFAVFFAVQQCALRAWLTPVTPDAAQEQCCGDADDTAERTCVECLTCIPLHDGWVETPALAKSAPPVWLPHRLFDHILPPPDPGAAEPVSRTLVVPPPPSLALAWTTLHPVRGPSELAA